MLSDKQLETAALPPRHIAIIMDGNGRWAQRKGLPRVAGHHAGVKVVRNLIEAAIDQKVSVLTLFAFGQENWRRPQSEVNYLMNLLQKSLKREGKRLQKNNIRLHVIGDKSAFSPALLMVIEETEQLTVNNTALQLVLAINYSGRWDLLQAINKIKNNTTLNHELTEADVNAALVTASFPEPDIFIRTSGEKRISNFLLWQLAYTELFFPDTLWPDFSTQEFIQIIREFTTRERRFGKTSQQLQREAYA